MKIKMDWMVNVVKSVPRRRGPTRRVVLLKVVAPRKKAIIEIRDLSQPQGLLKGWEEAPRPRKIVFPSLVSVLYRDNHGYLGGTCLHGQKTRPGIIGTAIT